MYLNEANTAKLLGRSLTTNETTNFKLYIKIANQRLEQLLCMNLNCDTEERTYQSRINYRTVYVDPLTSINSVTIDGNEVDADDYTLKQNDNLNASWYNVIEFDKKQSGKKIVIDAEWGFDECPHDLQLVLARLFALTAVEQSVDTHVKSKKIEDYAVTYKDSTSFDEVVIANQSIIDKYSYCSQGYIRHGVLEPVYYN